MTSDQQFVARAARQRRITILLLTLGISAACVFLAVRNTYYDLCTNSFDRSPETVVRSYLAAISGGDLNRVEHCWVRTEYFKTDTGCSEICLSRVVGSDFTVAETSLGLPYAGLDGRSNLDARVTVNCPNGSEHTGVVVLDALGSAVPWKHWRVAQSSVGGNNAAVWCQ